MKLLLSDVEYDVVDSLQGAALGHLMELKIKSKRPDDGFAGVTVPSIQRMFMGLGELAKEDGFEEIDLLGDLEFLDSIIGLVFLARRKAGEQVSYAEVRDTLTFDSFSFVADPDEVEADPKDEPAGEPPEIL